MQTQSITYNPNPSNVNMSIFSFEGKEIRTVVKDGTPWWIAKDICDVFGETNRNRAMQTLSEDEKGYTQMSTPGGVQQISIVNESGLYSMLFAMQPSKARGVTEEYITSREMQLRRFRRWVTHEVLPSIRKHGFYASENVVEKWIDDPDSMIQVLQAYKQEREKTKQLQAEAEQNAPKVLFAQSVEASKSEILIGELAKILKQNGLDVGQNRLFDLLRKDGFLISRAGTDWNMPTQYSMNLGLMRIKETTVTHADGHITVNKTPKITGKGQIYFINRYIKKPLLACKQK